MHFSTVCPVSMRWSPLYPLFRWTSTYYETNYIPLYHSSIRIDVRNIFSVHIKRAEPRLMGGARFENVLVVYEGGIYNWRNRQCGACGRGITSHGGGGCTQRQLSQFTPIFQQSKAFCNTFHYILGLYFPKT